MSHCLIAQSSAGESEELYNFHEAVSLLIETEEQLIDEHKTSIEVGIIIICYCFHVSAEQSRYFCTVIFLELICLPGSSTYII